MTAIWIVVDVRADQSFSHRDEFFMIRIAFDDIVNIAVGYDGLVVRLARGGEVRTHYVNCSTMSDAVITGDGTWDPQRFLIDDLERSVRRAMTVIGHELNMTTFDSNPFTPFAKLGTWAVDEDFSVYIGDARFLLKGLPAFDLTAPDEGGNGGPRRASIDAEQRQGIVDAILVMLRGGQ